MAGRQPETAARWVESIHDPDLKRGSMEDVARQWAGKDRAAAAQWLRTMGADDLIEKL